jgi:hypothetical protein
MAVGTACQVLVILITLQIPLTSASSRHEFIKPQVSLTNATEAKLLEPLPVSYSSRSNYRPSAGASQVKYCYLQDSSSIFELESL